MYPNLEGAFCGSLVDQREIDDIDAVLEIVLMCCNTAHKMPFGSVIKIFAFYNKSSKFGHDWDWYFPE